MHKAFNVEKLKKLLKYKKIKTPCVFCLDFTFLIIKL